jgi:hypothetical protein
MRTATLVFVLLLCCGLARGSDQKSAFKITFDTKDTTATRRQTLVLCAQLQDMVIKWMLREYPCADLTTDESLRNTLNWQRQRDLLGGNVEEDLKSLADALGLNEYLISLQVNPLGGRSVLNATCINLKSSKTVAMDLVASGEGLDAAVDSCDDFAKRFVRKLAYLEICPYKGPVHVTVQSKKNKEEKEEYPVYCNQSDQMYKKSTKLNKTTDTDWSLEKTGRRSASGTVTHQNHERTEVIEENGCYKCPSGRQGGRTSTQITTATEAIDGLSEESRREGKAQKDARITLKFNEDDTFTIHIEATSREGTRQESTVEKAEGTCDTKSTPPKVVEGKVNVPLPGEWGPFAGAPQDKILRGNKTETKTNPVTEEETTTSIEFELHRN